MNRRIALVLAPLLALVVAVVAQVTLARGSDNVGASVGAERLAGPRYTPQERQALIEYANASFAQKQAILVGAETRKGKNGLLVFQRQVGGHVQLFTIRPDGSGTRQVTHLTDSDALGGEWSPDGKRIVFARDYAVGTPSEHLDIEVIDADGRNDHPFGLDGLNGYPVWSPDGRKVLWLRAPGFAIANPDGTGMQPIRVPGENSSPTFSPDGRRIALRRDVGGGTAIYVVDVNGTGLKRVAFSKKSMADKIDWSPDGSRIVFSMPAFGPPLSSNVYTIRPNGSALTQLTHDTGGKINNGADSWSPDGRKIVFASNRAGAYQLFVMNADGSGVRQLTRGKVESHFAAWGSHA